MRIAILATLAAAGLMVGAVSATAAPLAVAASTRAVPSSGIERVTNVCGNHGCVRVQTQRSRHQKPGSVAARHI
jgi:hypothetical protein